MHVETKSETAAIEGLNSRIRHYLARFHRKTFCYSKAQYMDESCFNKHSYRPHGWALKGQKVYGDVSGNNRKDVNLIMAQCRKNGLRPLFLKEAVVQNW